MSTINLPSVLAFERKIEPSDALMFSGNWENIKDGNINWASISLFERRNRAVKSNFDAKVLKDEEKLQKEITEANLSWGDDAALNHEHDTLKISFSMRFLSGLSKPSTCNKPDFEKALKQKVEEYLQKDSKTLAQRYAYNIANGRFLWRNRIDASQICVIVTGNMLPEPLKFDSYDYPLYTTYKQDDEKLAQLANIIHQGLTSSTSIVLTIDAFAQLGKGQRVWPSQEMVMGLKKGDKSRWLFSLNKIAAIHSEKIGNAIRTIDDWYEGFDAEINSPIAIEAYGSVTQRGIAYRSSKTDFFTLLKKWVNSETLTEQDQHFVIAMLIRGGVFGEKEEGK